MSLHSALTEKLYDYLEPICAGAGIQAIIFDYENGVNVSGDYVAIDIRNITTDGRPEVVYKPIEGSATYENDEIVNYRGMVSFAIDIYSTSEAIFKAEELKIGMWRERAVEEAYKLNLGLVSYGETTNLTATQDGKYKGRSQFLVNINFTHASKTTDTTIGTVRIVGDVEDGTCSVDETVKDDIS